jgi:Ion channel
MCAHYFVCLWVFVGGRSLWGDPGLPWLEKNSMFETYDRLQLMIFANYWVFEVMTTVGYGDFAGGTKIEYIVTFFLEFAGLFVFSWISLLL